MDFFCVLFVITAIFFYNNHSMLEDQKTSFDKLVAGLSVSDRQKMLSQIAAMNKNVGFVVDSPVQADVRVPLLESLQKEPLIYRFFLWIRSIISHTPKERLYNDDLLLDIARGVDRFHPNLLNSRYSYLDSIFYERLKSLQDAANFYKPYFSFIREDFGDFYVFLGSFVAPELTDLINQEADPFQFGPEKEATSELRTSLLKKTDDIVKDMDPSMRHKIYSAVVSANWLMQFTDLPFIHFVSQFTDISNGHFTCPYSAAKTDFNAFAAAFANIKSVPYEVVQAIFLFSQRRSMSQDFKEQNISKAVNDFLTKSNTMFEIIHEFVKNVPLASMGKVVNDDYDWVPGNIAGSEAWFASFRAQWKKIIEIRWDDWQKERKKLMLGVSLKSDFELEDFPLMPDRPWSSVWSKVSFTCDLTGGFLAWYSDEKFHEAIEIFKIIQLEGIFIRPENKKEYIDSITDFTDANERMLSLTEKLSQIGEWGKFFNNMDMNKVKTMQVQNQIDSIFREAQREVREILMKFGKGARGIEAVLRGIFDERKDGTHESLQNLSVIGGRNSQEVKDKIQECRLCLKKTIYYISELEQIDTFSTF